MSKVEPKKQKTKIHKSGIFGHFDHILACFDLKIELSMKNYPRGLVQSFWGAPGLLEPPGPRRAPGKPRALVSVYL